MEYTSTITIDVSIGENLELVQQILSNASKKT